MPFPIRKGLYVCANPVEPAPPRGLQFCYYPFTATKNPRRVTCSSEIAHLARQSSFLKLPLSNSFVVKDIFADFKP